MDTTAGNYAAAVTGCTGKGATLTSILDAAEIAFITRKFFVCLLVCLFACLFFVFVFF